MQNDIFYSISADMLPSYERNVYYHKDDRDISFEILEGCPMKSFTTFKIGGDAEVGVFPMNKKSLVYLVGLLRERDLPFYVVGNGSNLLVCDEGYDSVVIFTTRMKKMSIAEQTVTVECGYPLTQLSGAAAKESLSGLEFAYGIPGTVGGAVFMNAGAYESEMKRVVRFTEYLTTDGRIATIRDGEHRFGYRRSVFMENGGIVLESVLDLYPGHSAKILSLCGEYMALRREKQPLEYPSAGSVFKRYPGRFTGKIIQDCGLKGCRVGDAMVSPKHAGFIVNCGSATANDVVALIRQIKETVFEREGIELECEMRYLTRAGETKI